MSFTTDENGYLRVKGFLEVFRVHLPNRTLNLCQFLVENVLKLTLGKKRQALDS
jgi:hypothetical protein